MKERTKEILSKEINILERSVPLALILIVALAGTGAAAVLATYGTVTGTANVDQAVTLDTTTNDVNTVDYTFQGEQTAGETEIETHTLNNNADVSATVDFDSTCKKGDTEDSESGSTSREIDWNTACDGIDTRYVEYYDNAGADIPDYSTEVTQDSADAVVGSGDTIQGALESTTAKDPVILVESGYDSSDETVGEFTHPDGKGPRSYLIRANPTLSGQDWSGELTIVSKAGPSETVIDAQADYGMVIGGDSTVATVKGFDIQNYNNVGILAGSWHNVDGSSYVNPERVDITHNALGRGPSDKFTYGIELAYTTTGTVKYNELEMQGLTGEKEVGAILVAETSDVVVSNNIIRNGEDSDELGIAVATFGGAFTSLDKYAGQEVKAPLENVTIKQNTITGGNQGIGIESLGTMSDVEIKNNKITGSNVTIDIVEYSDTYDGQITGTVVSENNILGGEKDINYTVDGETLDATGNWFGTDGIQTSGSVTADWETKSDLNMEAQTSDEFGIRNEFAINLEPDDYTLTTDIVPN